MQTIPQEIETKIIRNVPATLREFELLMKKVGANVKTPRRLLSDRRFRLKILHPVYTELSLSVFIDEGQGHAVLEFLGLTISAIKNNAATLTAHNLPRRVVRLRRDGTKIILTVKEMIDADKGRSRGQVKQRGEMEVLLINDEPIEKLIIECGYEPAMRREKYRTTYILNGTLIEWQECPSPIVPPWMEVEGESVVKVKEVITKLGFSPKDTAAISDAEYLHRCGLPKSQIKRLVFSEKHAP